VKNPKKKAPVRTKDHEHKDDLDWTSLFAAFRESFEWAFDVAAGLARDYPEEVEAVERVRTFMRKRIAGERAHARTDDVLFTFGLIIGAIERDLGPIEARPPWFAPSIRLPSVMQIWDFVFPRYFARELEGRLDGRRPFATATA
jgi:hypothetical protein